MREKVLNDELEETNGSDSVQAKEKKKNKTRKVIVTTTYFIAVLCLLAGLFAPLFAFAEGVPAQYSMMFRYLPSMVNGTVGKEIFKLGENSYFLPYRFIPGIYEKFDFLSLIGVLYAVVCIVALLMLIPVLLGSKKKNTSANCALGVEVLAMLVTLTYIAYATYKLTESGVVGWTDYNFLLAFGGVLLMAIVQTITSKGGIGVSKVIGLILSVIAVITLLDITLFIPKLATSLDELSVSINSGDEAAFINGSGGGFLGIKGINDLVSIKDTIESYKFFAKLGKQGIYSIVISVLVIVVAVFTVLNLLCDVIGLSTGKKYKKDRSPCANRGSNSFALTRYILTIIFAAAIIVMTFVIKDLGYKTGIYLWLLVIVLFISLINASVRTACDNARVRRRAVAPSEDVQQRFVIADPEFNAKNEPVAQKTQPEPAKPEYAPLPVAEETAPVAEPVAETNYTEEPEYVTPDYMPEGYEAQPAVEEEPAVVEPLSAPLEEEPQPAEPVPTVYIYGGATDEFMETLTDNEKVEFVELFIKKSKGKVNGVPDYEIDGDNSDFFPAVFVHINRYRNIVSDALMTKMYKQLGKLM